MTEPLPCPFCGSDQVAVAPTVVASLDGGDDSLIWDIICKACCANISREREDEAIAAWNSRVAETAVDRMARRLGAVWVPHGKEGGDG